jgi:hypothetical protein
MASSTSVPAWHEPRRWAALWVGLLTGPVVFLALLQTNYVMSYVACEARTRWFLHLATLVALLLVAGAGWLAWTHGPAEPDERHSRPITRDTTESRARWMSMAGVMMSAWFMLVILATEIPILVLKQCQ